MARIREVARVAAAFDRAVAGDAASDARARLLVPGGAPDREQLVRWAAGAAISVDALLAGLEDHGVTVLRPKVADGAARTATRAIWLQDILPLLTPTRIDEAHPIPRRRLQGLVCVGVVSPARARREQHVLAPVPSAAGRWLPLRVEGVAWGYVAAEDVVRVGLADLYGEELRASHVLRIVRARGEGGLPGAAVLIEHEPGVPAAVLERLRAALDLPAERCVPTRGLLGAGDLAELCDALDEA